MFNTVNGTEYPVLAKIYFSMIVLSGSYFFVNFILAVILQAFTEVH